jgi:hypothetical protein
MAALQTEFAFYLPKGFVDDDGAVHRRGIMRLATARDELEPLRDPRVRDAEDPFLTIIVLSRVVTELGTLSHITPREIEQLFAADLAYLQDIYGAVNFGTAADGAEVVAEAQRRIREEAEQDRATKKVTTVASETVDAESLAEALQARFGDEELAQELEELEELELETVPSRRRHVEEIGSRQN